MPDLDLSSVPPVYWPIADLRRAYGRGDISPVEVVEDVLRRMERLNPILNVFLCSDAALALDQARDAEKAYRQGSATVLSGIPISIKDTFHIAGMPVTYGSLVHRGDRSHHDSGVVRRLRAAGAVFVGKTNTAEFAQSATTDNRLGDHCRNPWDTQRTPGGSSGGAAVSVATGMATVGIGADGGGSIRIPAAFTGVFGLKPAMGACRDEDGFRAMTDFVCPGPLAWRVADARAVLSVLSDRVIERTLGRERLRIAWSPTLEGRPVEAGVAAVVANAVEVLRGMGHEIIEREAPVEGWNEAFGPLVLNDEKIERMHLLDSARDLLTEYELRTLQMARTLTDQHVAEGRRLHAIFRQRSSDFFDEVDAFVSPVTATPAFPVERRPTAINGQRVDRLWGAFPFTSPFNVAGVPAASVPCGFVDNLPVSVQIVSGRVDRVLDLAEDLERAVKFDVSPLVRKWAV